MHAGIYFVVLLTTLISLVLKIKCQLKTLKRVYEDYT